MYEHYQYSSESNSDKDKTDENVSKPATDFVSFLRQQTNKNLHLNLYTNKIKNDNKPNLLVKFKHLNKEEIAVILAKSVVTIQDDVVLLNKPNGISVQGDGSKNYSILDVLPELSKVLNLKDLQIVHRLDKDTTGALLLARTPEMAFLLKDAFKRRQIRKNYLCLLHGLPSPAEGVIDFPLKERLLDGQTIIAPDFKFIKKQENETAQESPMSTTYRVLCDNYNVALVQCSMLCGNKHQIRAHLAYGLDTPILGDHKYSWLIKKQKFPIMPQTLTSAALAGLQINENKTRHIPIHLHAHQIRINDSNNPNINYGNTALKSMDFHVLLPAFFVDALKKLKLYDQRILKNAMKHMF